MCVCVCVCVLPVAVTAVTVGSEIVVCVSQRVCACVLPVAVTAVTVGREIVALLLAMAPGWRRGGEEDEEEFITSGFGP